MHLELIAFLAGLISSTAAIPQIVRMIRTKKTGSVSTLMFCMKNCSNSLWLAFGIVSGTYSIIFWNVISFALCTTVIVMKYKILRDRAKAAAEKPEAKVIPMPKLAIDNTKEPMTIEPKKPALILVYTRPKEVQQELSLDLPIIPEQANSPQPQV